MGSTTARDMGGWFDLETAVRWHLIFNHYPPVPEFMVGPAVAAVLALREDDGPEFIDLPEGVTFKGGGRAPAVELADHLHLWDFV